MHIGVIKLIEWKLIVIISPQCLQRVTHIRGRKQSVAIDGTKYIHVRVLHVHARGHFAYFIV